MKNIYESKHYKKLLLIPVAVVLVGVLFVSQVKLGIDLKGGFLLSTPANSSTNLQDFEAKLSQNFELEEASVRKLAGAFTGFVIQFAGEKSLLKAQEFISGQRYSDAIELLKPRTGELNVSGDEKDKADAYFSRAREDFKNRMVAFVAQETGISQGSVSMQELGPALSQFFLNQALTALAVAFVFIVIIIFFFYRTPVISFAVVQAAFFDAFLGYAALGALGIPLSLATIAPLLMLIGYSVDTDIMLTNRVLRRTEATPPVRAWGAVKTGLTMVLTAISALAVLFVVSTYANITVLSQISIVLLIGLVGDIPATYCTNAVLILWHLEKKGKT